MSRQAGKRPPPHPRVDLVALGRVLCEFCGLEIFDVADRAESVALGISSSRRAAYNPALGQFAHARCLEDAGEEGFELPGGDPEIGIYEHDVDDLQEWDQEAAERAEAEGRCPVCAGFALEFDDDPDH